MAEAAVGAPPPVAGDCKAADVKCGACNKEDRHYATLLQPHKLPPHSRYSTLLLERQKTLGSSDLLSQVKLPHGAMEEEWLALCTVDMFNELNLLAGAVSDICTDQTCPVMSAGAYTFAWADGDKIKVPTKVSAPRYFEYLLSWVEKQLSDETFLPTQPGVAFPPTYRKGMRVIYKRLFRIYAHIFHAHFKEMMEQEADAHLNHSFKHFIYFVKEFDLVDDEELEPLKDLIALCMRQTH